MRVLSLFILFFIVNFYISTVQAHSTELSTVVVSSSGQSSIYDVAQPVTVLGKEDLDGQAGNTLGALLENTPGITNASFGAGVGRPVIRGMSGSRVKILQNGSDSADVSALSSDHAPMAETSSAEQIEILYGPATLMYGGGAIGGVVNLIDRRIHELPSAGVHGEISMKGSSVDKGYNTDAMLDAGSGHWVLHVDGFKRDAQNYRSGNGKVHNSDSEGQGGAVALSWANGHSGFVGASISTLDYDYAVPNNDGDAFRVKPKQVRYDVKGAWRPDFDSAWSWIDEWRTELSFNDYQHAETEPEDGEVLDVGLFEQKSWELQSRIRHQSFRQWQGTFGIQLKQQELALCHDHHGCNGIANISGAWDGSQGTAFKPESGFRFAHDTPMPIAGTQKVGVFFIERLDLLHGTLELGLRLDQVRISSNPSPIKHSYRQQQDYYDDKNFTPVTFSIAGTLVADEHQRIGLSMARVQRAPEATELFWNGDHHATFSYQLDNSDLEIETANTIDLNWQYLGDNKQIKVALFHYYFEDYIFNDLKPFPYHGEAVYRYEQSDARFFGAELSWQHNFNDNWHWDMAADAVSAKRTNGEALPRTPPVSLLTALNWKMNGWEARLESKAILKQNQTAANENSTAGFVLFNAYAGYRHLTRHGELQWRASVHNITDKCALNHVSYLKEDAPMPGRNVMLGVSYKF